jgi:hypothetical protein
VRKTRLGDDGRQSHAVVGLPPTPLEAVAAAHQEEENEREDGCEDGQALRLSREA